MDDVIIGFVKKHKAALADFEKSAVRDIKKAAQMIIDSLKTGGCVYLCGNGGSAADCQHIAAELVNRFIRNRRSLPAVALTTDTSSLTSIGNDFGFEDVFARQVEGLAKAGDVLWAISTSGTSANIIKAVEIAKNMDIKILAFTGKTDSRLEKLSDVCVCCDTKFSCTAQEIHALAYHTICELVDIEFAKQSKP